MKKQDVLKLSSMPLQSPTYPVGPYKFFERQYMIINYRTDPAMIRKMLPEPLEPDGDVVSIQWLDLPDGEGWGAEILTDMSSHCGTHVDAPLHSASQIEGAPARTITVSPLRSSSTP